MISATASFDLSLFIKIALQKEPWYPSRSRTPTPFPPSAILGAFLVSAKKRKRDAGNPRDGFTNALFWLERNTSCGQVCVEGRCAIVGRKTNSPSVPEQSSQGESAHRPPRWRRRRTLRSTATGLEWVAYASLLRSMLQDEVGICKQEPKPDGRNDSQGDRRDDPKMVMRHQRTIS